MGVLLLQGDLQSEPHTANYTFKQVMQLQNTTYEIDLCPSQLKQARIPFYHPSCVASHPLVYGRPRPHRLCMTDIAPAFYAQWSLVNTLESVLNTSIYSFT